MGADFVAWRDRAVDDAASVQRSRDKVIGRAERIVAACRELYYETGGQDFTIQELSARSEIALQTFYRYFKSKDELLLAVLEEVLREGSENLVAIADKARTPLRRLELLITSPLLMNAGPDMPVFARLVVTEHLRLEQNYPKQVEEAMSSYLRPLIEHIEAAVAAGELVERPHLDRDARVITALVTATYHRLTLGLDTEDRETIARHVWGFCFGALSNPTPAPARRAPRRK
jgi:TetR/AcrR family transcriptional regulator